MHLHQERDRVIDTCDISDSAAAAETTVVEPHHFTPKAVLHVMAPTLLSHSQRKLVNVPYIQTGMTWCNSFEAASPVALISLGTASKR